MAGIFTKTSGLPYGDFIIPVNSQNQHGLIKISKKLPTVSGVIVMIRGMNRSQYQKNERKEGRVMEFDAIIIGGGLSGLTAASLLAKSGLASWLSGFKIKVDR
ncbi:hypothetical protein [Acetobacterium wieringae]|nr:hypothetical protein [Acetobacterium wieringae]